MSLVPKDWAIKPSLIATGRAPKPWVLEVAGVAYII